MKERSLKISGDLWIAILKTRGPQAFKVIKNALPEDARCVGIGWSSDSRPGGPVTISLKITSSVFRDDDPDDLPEPILTNAKGE